MDNSCNLPRELIKKYEDKYEAYRKFIYDPDDVMSSPSYEKGINQIYDDEKRKRDSIAARSILRAACRTILEVEKHESQRINYELIIEICNELDKVDKI